jgi:hypothetical protein
VEQLSAADGLGPDERLAREFGDSMWDAEVFAGIDRIDSKVGINYIETEENAEGDRVLDSVLPRLVARVQRGAADLVAHGGSSRARCGLLAMCADAVRAANFLSLIWSGWDKHAAALQRLRAVKAAYRLVKAALRRAGPTAEDEGGDRAVFACEQAVASDREDSLRHSLEVAFTHTHFYMAQVYAQLGHVAAAASHIESTLARQVHAPGGEASLVHAIESSALDRLDWARNCLRLSEFHRNHRRWSDAAKCVAAARAMVAEEQLGVGIMRHSPPASGAAAAVTDAEHARWYGDLGERTRAECRVHWGHLHRDILRVARDREIGAVTEVDMLGPLGEVGPPRAHRCRRGSWDDILDQCSREAWGAALLGLPCGQEMVVLGVGGTTDRIHSINLSAVVLPREWSLGIDDLVRCLELARGPSRSEVAQAADPEDSATDDEADADEASPPRVDAFGDYLERATPRVEAAEASGLELELLLVKPAPWMLPPEVATFEAARDVFRVANQEYKDAMVRICSGHGPAAC